MGRRIVATAAAVVAMLLAFAPLAGAANNSLVTVTTTSTGTRTITASTGPTFPVQDLSLSGGNVVSTVNASTTLTEVFATGATWSIKAQICAPNDYTTPTTSDCTTNGANHLVRSANGLSPTYDSNEQLNGSTMSLQRQPATVLGTPTGSTSPGSETDLTGQVTLLSSSNELSATTYNGIYTVATGVTINNLTRTGTWKGYWVVTQTT